MKNNTKTNIVVIKMDYNLKGLASALGVNETELQCELTNHLLNEKLILDCMEECGETVGYNCKQIGISPRVLLKKFLTIEPTLLQIAFFKALELWGIENDCPRCGFEREYKSEFLGVQNNNELFDEFKVCHNCDIEDPIHINHIE